ncbi:MAG: hypothetical protein ACK46C_14220, partial [Flavobacteriales bacterium]
MIISIFITLVTLVQRLWLRLLIIAVATAITSLYILKNSDLRIAMVLFSLVFMLTYAVDMTKLPSALRTANMPSRRGVRRSMDIRPSGLNHAWEGRCTTVLY